MAEKLCLIRTCAAIAETEGTCSDIALAGTRGRSHKCLSNGSASRAWCVNPVDRNHAG